MCNISIATVVVGSTHIESAMTSNLVLACSFDVPVEIYSW